MPYIIMVGYSRKDIYIYIYVYIYMCVCACVGVCVRRLIRKLKVIRFLCLVFLNDIFPLLSLPMHDFNINF